MERPFAKGSWPQLGDENDHHGVLTTGMIPTTFLHAGLAPVGDHNGCFTYLATINGEGLEQKTVWDFFYSKPNLSNSLPTDSCNPNFSYPLEIIWTFLQIIYTLRIIGPSYRGVWICIAGFRDLQTPSFEIPWFFGYTVMSHPNPNTPCRHIFTYKFSTINSSQNNSRCPAGTNLKSHKFSPKQSSDRFVFFSQNICYNIAP